MSAPDPAAPERLATVMLVEDHASYRQALETLMDVQGDLRVVAQVGSVDEAGPAAARTSPRVAVVDLDLATGSGVDALADIRRQSPGTSCVVLSALNDDVEFGRAIEAGAVAALHKSVSIPELLDVLRAVARGATILPPDETSRRLQALARHRDQNWYATVVAQQLTPREREVLGHLAEGHGHQQIAADLCISPETAQTHIRNLLGKLLVSSRLEAVVKGLRLGLVDPPRPHG
ncbi:MAG: response regulator [Egibacteraceae bacterium]